MDSTKAVARPHTAMVQRARDVLRAQGKLAEAHAAFDENLAISRRLANQDPSNGGWQQHPGDEAPPRT